jgi:HAD superfamily hydrolase (TIGR01509 family)
MSKKYENLLFDFDGCLVTSIDFWINIYKDTLGQFDIYPSDKETMFHLGDWDLHKHFGIEDDVKFTELVNSKLTNHEERQMLSANLLEMLEHLNGEHNIAVVSSGVKSDIVDTLVKSKIDHHFSVIIGIYEVEKYKPHPEPIFTAMSFLNADAENSIMIGDSRKDIEAANNAGIDSILYYPDAHNNTHDLDMLLSYKPTYVVKDLLEIPEIVG